MPPSFRTVVKPSRPPFQITHEDRIMTIGSCFSEHVGSYFHRYKFKTCINPFGQQYNPYSIAHAIDRLLNPSPYTASEIGHQNELYHSYDHHGSFSRSTMADTLDTINANLSAASASLQQATVLMLTFGTAHFFRLKDSGRVVSNCHKMPASNFDMEMMKADEIADKLDSILQSLSHSHPHLKIILTVSPVRYFAFGHFENSVSKGQLFAAIHSLRGKRPDLYYFPAYELVVDDLRDYRFYADDMLHPSPQAIDYVWHTMVQTMFPSETRTLLKEIEDIHTAATHRPRNPDSDQHTKFADSIRNKIQKLEMENGFDFKEELKNLTTR